MNYFNMSYDEVVNEIPYPILVFLSASVPKYSSKPKEDEDQPKDLFGILSKQSKSL